MPNPVAIVSPAVALTVLQEGIGLCQSIIHYRQQAMQVELAREQMHTQANVAMAEIEHEFAKDMAQLQRLSHAFHLTLKTTRKESKTHVRLLEQSERQISELLQVITSPHLPTDVRVGLSQTLQMITQQQGALYSEFIQKNSQAVNAFAIFADSIRTSPRVFTEVR